ncbi:MAG: hypothetical protein Q7Q73_12105 [Verrucomicrobiota bacterium JB024]|nr:hypothetical protein [Verrucomicrobiota bacterium JB024]
MGTDVSQQIMGYRECVRCLWNNSYAVPHPSYSCQEWDKRDRFASIAWLLFYGQVLVPIGREQVSRDPREVAYPYLEPLDFIKVSFRGVDKAELLVSGLAGNGQWKSVSVGSSDVDLTYLDFFDWSELESRDFQYVRVRISEAANPEIVGKDGLVDVDYAHFIIDEPVR